MSATRAWLADFTWDIVTAQNAVLCAAKNALHKPTSDGHAKTKALWDLLHPQVMRLDEAVDLCRKCHRRAPFCFCNGYTFASIIALVIKNSPCQPRRPTSFAASPGTLWPGWRRTRKWGRSASFANGWINRMRAEGQGFFA
jgi:hypothetical protein